jgi:23S rRNA (guanosine2251-2'-O)-methyltransferase
MAKNTSRAGAVRKSAKGRTIGTGGQGRQALEGRKPTPKAEDRPYHPKGKAKAARDRLDAKRGVVANKRPEGPTRVKRRSTDDVEVVTGRNAVLEALRAHIPATTLYMATRIEFDDRVREILATATKRGIPMLEVMRPELDRMAGHDAVHQGIALKVPSYVYAHPGDLLDQVLAEGKTPLFVALDGITDPRNLGAIIRSTGAFGGQGVLIPQRRSAGMTASAWRSSAGAAARVPVAMAANLTQTLKSFKQRGVFVLGLDGGGDIELPGLDFADRPLVIVTGSEGKGLSRLVTETCDAIVSIPISEVTESLNAGIATSVALYEISKLRAQK